MGRSVRLGALAAAMCLISGAPVAAAANPSFDCDRQVGEIEQMICGDDELAALDLELARAFAAAMARAPADQVFVMRKNQTHWQKVRNDCRKTDDARQCTIEAYRRRLSEL